MEMLLACRDWLRGQGSGEYLLHGMDGAALSVVVVIHDNTKINGGENFLSPLGVMPCFGNSRAFQKSHFSKSC